MNLDFLLPTLQLIFQVYTPPKGKCRFLRMWSGDVKDGKFELILLQGYIPVLPFK